MVGYTDYATGYTFEESGSILAEIRDLSPLQTSRLALGPIPPHTQRVTRTVSRLNKVAGE